MDLFDALGHAIQKNPDRPAFCINGLFYSYGDLAAQISGIRMLLRKHTDIPQKGVGLICNDDVETYAAIIAIWLESRYYVPLDLQSPAERIEQMIRQAEIKIIISSTDFFPIQDCISLTTANIPSANTDLSSVNRPDNTLVYTLFTSGSTGTPKGVPITHKNLSTFVDAVSILGLETDENDRWLQKFDLSFDLSVYSFLIPLLQGACIYTVPKNKI